ncbi:cation transporter [Neobacillus mesonae]|nr:cation transporter [Neobacillus mesonae]
MTTEYFQTNRAHFWTGVLGNLGLTILKGSVGYISGNKALLSDAMYSAGEVSTLITGRYGKSKDDSLEGVSKNSARLGEFLAFIIPLLVILGALQIAFSSVYVMVMGDLEPPRLSVLIIAFIAFVVREIWFQYEWRRSYKDKQAIHRMGRYHRLALYNSLIVLAGITLAMIGNQIEYSLFLYGDPLAALIASGIVIWKGYVLISDYFLGQKERGNLRDTYDYMETVQRVHGIVTVEHMTAYDRQKGICIDMKITVNPRMTITEAQEVSERAKTLLMGRFDCIEEVNVEVMPYLSEYPYKSNCELAERESTTLLQ